MKRNTITQLCLLSVFLLTFTPMSMLYAADDNLWVEQSWLTDPAESLNAIQALQHFQQDEGKPLTNKVFQLGSELQQIWILLKVSNQQATPQTLRLQTGVPYSRLLRTTLIRSNQPHTLILNEHEQRRFAERNNAFRLLNSDAFTVASGESVRLLVQTKIEGASYLPFSVLTVDEFNELRLQDSLFAALFYGCCLTLAVLFLLFSLAVKHRVAILYAVLFLLGLLIMADIDGYAFQWLWSNSPQWNHMSPLVILPLLNALGFFIIYQLLVTVKKDGFVQLKRLALVLMIIALVIPLLLPLFSQASLIQIENLLSIPAFLLQPLAFTTWLHLGRRSYASWLALLVISLVVVFLVLLVFIDILLPELLLQHSHHMAYAMIGIIVMAIITVQLMGLHKDQQLALQRELALAQQNAQINAELLQAEKNYVKAQQLARQHQQQLATASHDLRQPIVSLRSSVDAIAIHQPQQVRQQLQQAFHYLENLCTQYLQTSHPKHDTTDSTIHKKPVNKTEAYPVSLILNTVQRMFTKEATSRQIELRKVDCSVMLTIEPLVLMRIVSNLTANAIKHHSGSKHARVLLGGRRNASGVNIMVCDNGKGMTTEDMENLQQPYHKGETSTGKGLGLAIIQQLAQDNGLVIHMQSEVGKGSCFVVGSRNATS